MAAPEWFVAHLDALRRVPGSRPASARTLADWAAQIGDAEAPSRPTISRWLGGTTLPTGFRQLELTVAGVREHTTRPTREVRETLLRTGWWRDAYDRALQESGRADASSTRQPAIVYQGLEPFGRDDADRFHGRGPVIDAVRSRLDALHRSPAGGVLVVLGQSGVGKSSLLAAGLLPALEKHGLASDSAVAGWPAAVITPGPDPMAALADAAGERPSAPMILLVDQFEEVFSAEDDVRRRFVDSLVALSTPRDGDGPRAADVVVIACRNEFYPDLRRLPPLRPALDAPFNVDPLTADELTEAIREPARRAGITIGADLVTRVLTDAGVGEGGTIEGKLPLISHVLRIMNQAGPMTVRAYDRVGGIEGAVAHTATRAWGELHRAGVDDVAMAMLVRLVRVGDHPGHDTRRRLRRHELPGAGDERTARALEILAAARLVTIGDDSVQITHEALVRAWQRLRDTIDDERTDHVLRQNIALRARQWDEAGRLPEQLMRGTILVDAHRVTSGDAPAADVGGLSREFLAAADAQERLEAVRRRRLWAAAVMAAVLIVATGVIAVVAGVAERRASQRAVLSEVIAQAKQLSSEDSSLAAQLWLTAYRMQPSPELYTALLSTENTPLSWPLRGHTDGVRSVHQVGSTIISASEDGTVRMWSARPGGPPPTVLTEPGPVTALAVDPARRIMVGGVTGAGSGRSTIRVWSIADPTRPAALTGPLAIGTGAPVAGLSISPDGRLLVVAGSDGVTRLWNVTDPARPADLGVRLPGTTSRIYASTAAVSPDNRVLAVAGGDGSTLLWDVTDPARPAGLPPLAGGSGVAHSVAFGPDGRMLVTGGGSGSLRLWDVADPARARLIAQPPTGVEAAPSVLAAAVSPDGDTVAATAADNTVTLWNVSDPTRPIPLGRPLAGHGRGVGAVAFGPGGTTLVTGSADDVVRVWSLPATRLTSATGTVTSLAFSGDGRLLAAGGGRGDNTVHLWDASDPASPTAVGPPLPMPSPGFVNAIQVSPDGSLVVGASGPSVRMWDVRDPRAPGRYGIDVTTPSVVGGVAVSPDERTLAVGGADGLTRLFGIADPARPAPLGGPLPSTPGELVTTVAFSPDGRVLATAGADKQVRIWDTSDPARPRPLAEPLRGHTDQIFRIAFSPDGRHLASVGANHTTHIWDLTDPARPREDTSLLGQTDAVGGVGWSAGGTLLATGSDDRTVALWDMTDPARGRLVGDPITGHTDNVTSTAFGSGLVLASAGRDRAVRLWDLDVDHAIRRVCDTAPDNLTPEAWNAYVSPDLDYDPPCGTAEDN